MDFVKLVHTDIDHKRLAEEVLRFLVVNALVDCDQVGLTSVTGEDDWTGAVGKIKSMDHPERFYKTINKSLANTYIAELLDRYPDYYRWRLLRLCPKQTYTVHRDSMFKDKRNFRLHIPVITNPDTYLMFMNNRPSHDTVTETYCYHMEVGNSYQIETTGFHTAVNYGNENRYHIVGVRYEIGDNWAL